jgi:heme/copper-type cytochrome/quinol oxidase subunit 4
MSDVMRLHATRAWTVLVAAGMLSWALTEKAAAVRFATTAVILIAAFKVRLVVIYFMELQWQSRPWRVVFELWTLAVTGIILGGYWLA